MSTLHLVADRIVDAGDAEWAWVAHGTLLTGVGSGLIPNIARIVVRSGHFAVDDETGDPDPRTWGPRGWAALERAIRSFSAGPRLLVRPAWTDVISDAPSCLKFLGVREEWRKETGVVLDPAGMLAPSMLVNAEDHVQRIMELVAGHEGVAAVIATGPFAGQIASLTPPGLPIVGVAAQPAS